MNKVILIGNVGSDPEVRQVGESQVVNFSLATSKSYKKKNGEKQTDTEWHNIVIWGNLSKVIELYVKKGDKLDIEVFRSQLAESGYRNVSQVMEHGEFSTRGSLIDLFPMGNDKPYRIDLFDDEIETIRSFNPDDQRTIEKIDKIELLPAHEFPLNKQGIAKFHENYSTRISRDLARSQIYDNVTDGNAHSGIQYYLPLFFDNTST